jgi:ubiquinone/menaquinone biosynthesis C-methylase UbiE
MAPIDTDRTIAAFFDARVDLFESFTPDELARLRDCLRAWDLRPGLRVLEPGCGSGRLTALLADAIGINGEVWALDVSEEMIRRARARGLPAQARFLRASASAVPAETGYFDRVVCCCVFPHFLDPSPILAEMIRVLKPGGRLIVQHLEGREAVNEFHRTVAANAPSRPIPSDDAMRRLFDAAGFAGITIADRSDGYRAEGRKE